MDSGRPSEAADDGVRRRIDALARRYGIADDGARSLERVVRWLGWDRSNFVPATVPELPDPQPHLPPDEAQAALLQDIKDWEGYVRAARVEPQG